MACDLLDVLPSMDSLQAHVDTGPGSRLEPRSLGIARGEPSWRRPSPVGASVATTDNGSAAGPESGGDHIPSASSACASKMA